MSDLTRDEILRGRLVIWQPRDGYRFSVDPLLLLDFVCLSPTDRGKPLAAKRACDLGAGTGILALGLARKISATQVTAVELQPRLAEIARKNVVENQLAERVSVLELDLADARAARTALPGASFDLVVSNPPFRPLGEGGINPSDEEAIARHEVRLTLADLVRECKRLLEPGGTAAMIYPAERLTPLLSALDEAGLRPLRLRLVHPRAGEAATRALVEAKKGAHGLLTVEPPLVLLDDDGAYTTAARRALGEA